MRSLLTGRPLVFAHRGGAALARENTLDAFDNALALGADGIEVDVHLSRDGVLVAHHDWTLDRTTTLRGAVAEHMAADLKRAGVPALADVLARSHTAQAIVELKVNSREAAAAAVDCVRRADAVDRVVIGSFGWRVLRAVRRLEPAIATGAAREEVRMALYRSWCRWPIARARYQAFQVPEVTGRTRVVSAQFVRDAHAAGVAVQVWTVNDHADAERLLSWGVDALITDRPDVMVPIVKDR